MIRRIALGTLAVPFLLRPTLAQSPGAERAQAPNQSATPRQSAAADQQRMQALGGMAFALASSQLAERSAENAAVKLFATLEAEEQTTFTNVRRHVGLQVPTPEMMDDQKRQLMQQIQGLRGAEFDRAYVRAQMAGHQELLRLHQAIASTPANREEEIIATLAVPGIKSHLAMLEGLSGTMRG
ncbi:DUF4142 domain-containing protein [Falsiroseomonas sp. CW058]|uniref:DUF4142 domain-containing protein n=1 Tax=Falsiroseomonas sp. CW058 TaxID=3388664 RepID=UPI003D3144E2